MLLLLLSYVSIKSHFLTKFPSIWEMTIHLFFTPGFAPNSASVMQRLSLICHCQPNPIPNQSHRQKISILWKTHSLSFEGRFDEDGSWIGQYGTLRRKHQQRVSAESGLPPGATYVWWSSWSSSWSWWWSSRPWWWTRPGKTLERNNLGRIKSRCSSSCQAPSTSESRHKVKTEISLPQSEEIPYTKARNLVHKAQPWSLLRWGWGFIAMTLQWRMALIWCHFKPSPTHVICYNSNLLSHPQRHDHHLGEDHLDGDHLVDVNESESRHDQEKVLPCRQKSLAQASCYHDGHGDAFGRDHCNQGGEDNHDCTITRKQQQKWIQ